jgi:hypothetical protein
MQPHAGRSAVRTRSRGRDGWLVGLVRLVRLGTVCGAVAAGYAINRLRVAADGALSSEAIAAN